MSVPTVADVKANLKIEGTEEDGLIASLVSAAISYAEAYQHLPDGYYTTPDDDDVVPEMQMRTWQGIVLLASQWYESRLGDTGGFFADKPDAAQQGTIAVNNLLRLDRDWKVG